MFLELHKDLIIECLVLREFRCSADVMTWLFFSSAPIQMATISSRKFENPMSLSSDASMPNNRSPPIGRHCKYRVLYRSFHSLLISRAGPNSEWINSPSISVPDSEGLGPIASPQSKSINCAPRLLHHLSCKVQPKLDQIGSPSIHIGYTLPNKHR